MSLVGRHIRAILHQLGPAVEVFEAQRIHLVSQAASDLNITFVVDEGQADRLVHKLHTLLFSDERVATHLGPSWRETFETETESTEYTPTWWQGRQEELMKIAQATSPAYVYHGPTIDRSAEALRAMNAVDRVFYAVAAQRPCRHPEALKRARHWVRMCICGRN